MKVLTGLSLVVVLLVSGAPALAQQPGPELVQESVDAYNSHDVAYFERRLADDVVWLDEDGHALTGKATVLRFLGRQFNQTPSRTLTVSNVRVGNTTDAAWATFAYMLMGGDAHIMGMNTTVYKKVGNDWQIAVVHGAVNTAASH